MPDIIPFLGLTPEQQASMGLDQQTTDALTAQQQAANSPLAYRAGQAVRSFLAPPPADVVKQMAPLGGATPLDALASAVPAAATSVAQFAGGVVGNALPSANAAESPAAISAVDPNDPNSPAARIAAAMAARQPPPGARPGTGGAPGSGLEGEVKKAYDKQQRELGAAQQDFAKAGEEGKIAQNAETEALVKQGQDEANVVAARNQRLQEVDAQNKEHQLARQDQEQQQVGKLDELNSQWRDAKVDPSRLYKHADGTTNYGKTVGAALMVGLNALGNSIARNGGPNGALQILDQATERDIQQQRETIANAKDASTAQRQYLSDLRQKFGSDAAADLAYKDSVDADFRRKLEETLANTKAPLAQANGQKVIAALDERAAGRRQELAQITGADFNQNASLRNSIRTNAAQLAIAREEAGTRRAAAEAKGGHIPGTVGTAISPQALNEAAKVKGAMDGMRASLKELRTIHKEYGVETFGPQKERYNALTKDLQTQYAVLKQMGAVSGSEQEKLDAVIQNPNRFFGAEKSMDTVDHIINNSGRTALKAYGLMEENDPALMPQLQTLGPPQ